MSIVVTIETTNTFKDIKSYLLWKRAMQASGSIVDFEALEATGTHIIKSGTVEDGSWSEYGYKESE
jgi:hypothetical protein